MNQTEESGWCWCSPCALVWVVIAAAGASRVWFNIDWAYCVAAVVVLIPTIAVFVHEEREDIHDAAQSIVAEVWWLFRGWKKPAAAASAARRGEQRV